MTKIALNESELLKRANEKLKKFPNYIEGMQIESARMENHTLIMDGYCFMDNGQSTEKTDKASSVYNELAKCFAQHFTLTE